MKSDLLKELNAARRGRQAAVLVTDLARGEARLVLERDGTEGDPLAVDLARAFRTGVSGTVTMEGGDSYFLTVHVPPPRLIVIGAVHISQALAPMARLVGFDTTVIDPRTAFATPERFPEVRLVAEWPEDALKAISLDAFTGLVALTHDPKIDDLPLVEALNANCFYIGALGSRKTHGRRIERLREQGMDEQALARIHAPIGLAIGAQSPAEIAVAILAEIIETLRNRGRDSQEAGP